MVHWESGTKWFHKLRVMLISLCFFTFVSLIQERLKVLYYLRLSLPLSKCCIIFSLLYPGQSGKRSKLRVSWSLLAGLCWSLKYHISISLCFSNSTSLAQSYLKASYYLRLHFTTFTSLVKGYLKLSLSQSFFVSKLGQSGTKPEHRVMWSLVAAFCWTLARDKTSCFYVSLLSDGWCWWAKLLTIFSPNFDFNN